MKKRTVLKKNISCSEKLKLILISLDPEVFSHFLQLKLITIILAKLNCFKFLMSFQINFFIAHFKEEESFVNNHLS